MTEKRRLLQALKEDFVSKSKGKRKYSLRAYARDLQISPALLSLVLSGKRRLSGNLALLLRERFGSTPADGAAKVSRNTQAKTQGRYDSTEFSNMPAENLDFEWQDLVIADLLTVQSVRVDVAWIAKVLGITSKEVANSFERLVRANILTERDGRFIKTKRKIQLTPKISLDSVRRYHRVVLRKADLELERGDEASFQNRHISGMTIAVNPDHFSQAERLIQAFQQELADLLTQGKCTALYQLGFQLFPIYRPTRKSSRTLS